MTTWIIILGMAVVTFGTRYAFFAESVRYQVGPKLRKLLGYSSFAILTAIWTPIMFSYNPTEGFDYAGNDYLIAGMLAAVLAFVRVKTIIVVLLSTALFFALRFYVF